MMKIKKITEGMSGQQVADLIYDNFMTVLGTYGSEGGLEEVKLYVRNEIKSIQNEICEFIRTVVDECYGDSKMYEEMKRYIDIYFHSEEVTTDLHNIINELLDKYLASGDGREFINSVVIREVEKIFENISELPELAEIFKSYIRDIVIDEYRGKPNGVASLDENGLVPTEQLPSYVDDIVEGFYVNVRTFLKPDNITPYTPEKGKIYVDLNKYPSSCYRWSGLQYVLISNNLVVGTNRGDAYDGAEGSANRAWIKRMTDHAVSHIKDSDAFTANDISVSLNFDCWEGQHDAATEYSVDLPVATDEQAGIMTASEHMLLTTTLPTNLASESTTRAAADDTLQTNINKETVLRESAINNLQEQINNVKTTVEGNGVAVTYSLSKSGSTITLTGSDGSTTSVTDSDTNTTYSNATTSSAGLMSATDKSKLDSLSTTSGSNVSFTAAYTSGTKIGTITIDGVSTDIYIPIWTGTLSEYNNITTKNSDYIYNIIE